MLKLLFASRNRFRDDHIVVLYDFSTVLNFSMNKRKALLINGHLSGPVLVVDKIMTIRDRLWKNTKPFATNKTLKLTSVILNHIYRRNCLHLIIICLQNVKRNFFWLFFAWCMITPTLFFSLFAFTWIHRCLSERSGDPVSLRQQG